MMMMLNNFYLISIELYIQLSIHYGQLQRVTQNCTRNTTPDNCSKVEKQFYLCDLSQLLKQYNTFIFLILNKYDYELQSYILYKKT
jgi:hypothetical protein